MSSVHSKAGSPPPMDASLPRYFSLDVLRGVAIMLVLCRHLPGVVDSVPGSAFSAAGFLHRVGWSGVDLFFVLSGFLISTLLFREINREGRIHLLRFWMRRGFKIWPCYFVAYGLMVAWEVVRGGAPRGGASVLANVFFIQNYFPPEIRWPHSWSLAVEEHFYLLLPLLLSALLGRRSTSEKPGGLFRLLPLGLLACAVILTVRIGMFASGERNWESYYYATHLRADGLLFGVLIGFANCYFPERLNAISRFSPGIWLLLAIAILGAWKWPLENTAYTCTVGFTLFYLSYGGLVAVAARHPNFGEQGTGTWRIFARALAWVGVYSYTIYLAHSVVGKIIPLARLAHLLPGAGTGVWVQCILYLTLSILGGVLLSHAVERPFLALRARWFPSKRASKETVVVSGSAGAVEQQLPVGSSV